MNRAKQTDGQFDILVIPQLDHRVPAPHLDPENFDEASAAWDAYGTTPPDYSHGSWAVGIAHVDSESGAVGVTSILDVPRLA